MISIDSKGLQLAVGTAPANPDESRLIRELFGFMLSAELLEQVIGDEYCLNEKLVL